jgi:hypothetical protein
LFNFWEILPRSYVYFSIIGGEVPDRYSEMCDMAMPIREKKTG